MRTRVLSRLQESHAAEVEKFRAEMDRMRERFREQGVELPDPDAERRELEAAMAPADGGKPRLHFAMGRRASAPETKPAESAARDTAAAASPVPAPSAAAAAGAKEGESARESASLSNGSTPTPVEGGEASISAAVLEEMKEHKAGLMVLKAFLGRRSRHARKVSQRVGNASCSLLTAHCSRLHLAQNLSQFEASKLYGADAEGLEAKGKTFVDPGQMYHQMKSKAKDVVSLKAEVGEKQEHLAQLQSTLEELQTRREELKYGCVSYGLLLL